MVAMLRFKRILILFAAATAALVVLSPLVRGAGGDTVFTVAGGGAAGDGGPAVGARLDAPSDVVPLGGGAFLIADTASNRIRMVDADGLIRTVAGTGAAGFGGDGGAAVAASLNRPEGLSVLPGGGFLIADTGNNRIRKVGADGLITTVAGSGAAGFDGDDGPATGLRLNRPEGVAALSGGRFLIADTANNRIRIVDQAGVMTTSAGTGVAGFGGDGGPPFAARLNAPTRIMPLPGGTGAYLIADTGNSLVRMIGVDGDMETAAGTFGTGAPSPGFSGDGGHAADAQLNAPVGLATLPGGAFLIADSANDRIRAVAADGTITTLAGTGASGFGGDGGAPAAAQLSHPLAVVPDGDRTLIADSANARVRAIGQPPVNGGGGGTGSSTATDTGSGAPTATGTATTATTPPPAVPQPVLGQRAVAAPDRGRVLVRLPGTRRFVVLTGRESIPLGSELDTTNGIVSLRFATDRTGTVARAAVSEGRFVLRQPNEPVDGQVPGELDLSGPLAACAPPRARGALLASAARRVRFTGRRARVRARGKVRTRGRYGAAVVRGTRWTMVDRCPSDPAPGTFVLVREHVVAVTSFVLQRTVLVSEGHTFLAPARRP
jgi:ribosomal protein S11